jgi:hypothetical protein
MLGGFGCPIITSEDGQTTFWGMQWALKNVWFSSKNILQSVED